VDTPCGRLSTATCFDASFPDLIRQAGRTGVDVLLVPSSDWEQVTGALAEQATLRAVENGVTVVRPARRGVSVAVDPHGGSSPATTAGSPVTGRRPRRR
jgi:apolipoprotein N-acyltransferase